MQSGAASAVLSSETLSIVGQAWTTAASRTASAKASGSAEGGELLQAALLDPLSGLAQLSAEAAVAVGSGIGVHLIGTSFADVSSLPISVGEQALELWLALLKPLPAAASPASPRALAASVSASAAATASTSCGQTTYTGPGAEPLLALFPTILSLISRDSAEDYLKLLMQVLEEYLLVFGSALLADDGQRATLWSGFSRLLLTPCPSKEANMVSQCNTRVLALIDVFNVCLQVSRVPLTAGLLRGLRVLELAIQLLPAE